MGGHSKPGANPLNMNAHQEVAPAGGYKNVRLFVFRMGFCNIHYIILINCRLT